MYENKSLISKESKEKLEMSFMYEPPPGTKKEEDRNEDSSQPFKFDWQRTWGNAPRGSWVAKDEMINEKPFGIAVRHVRCLKCRKYGHINTDIKIYIGEN